MSKRAPRFEPSAASPALAAAVAAYRRGGLVVVVDDEHRENEGDLIVAAEKATPEALTFMIRHAGGLMCVALTRERLAALGLTRMAARGAEDPFRTAFMESVDARAGVTTGISAHDRARTVRALLDPRTRPEDLIRPGHIFPLEAVEFGVLRRPGHTEAAVDLARLAGLQPAGVICEILNPDGTMARRPQLEAFARRHRLPLVTIADLVTYRRATERLVELERTVRLPTDFAEFRLHMYRALPEQEHHLALTLGALERGGAAPLVRMHSECLTGDVFGSQRCDCGRQLHEAMRRIAGEGRGAIIYLRQEGRGIGLAHKIHAYALQEAGLDTVEANKRLGFEPDLRDYYVGAQILRELGIRRVRLLTNNPHKVEGLRKYGVEVAERVPLVTPATPHNRRYLRAKREKLGHLL